MKEITKQWIEYAKADLMSCRNNLQDAFLTNIVAFHAQQAIEKCFKAIIEENGMNLPRIHDLTRLYSQIDTLIHFTVDLDLLNTLDGIYTTSRYPGDFGLIEDGKPTITFAQQLFEFANDIYDKTLKMIKQVK